MKVESMKVEYVDHMGSDAAICDAARVSFDKLADNYTPEQNEKLLSYLVKHNHWSPLAHTAIKLRVKAPIFVARQLVKHQIGLVWNEVSRRYVDSEVEIYLPEFWRKRAPNLKQGSLSEEVKVNTYGNGICVRCGSNVPRKSVGPRGKWCSARCRAAFRKEHDPDFRLHSTKYNAEARGLEFNLERGDIEWVTHCPLLGIELDYSVSEGKNPDNSPSIDRIDPSKGYIKGNVWVISNKANRMKNDGSNEELITFARNILLAFNGQMVPRSGSAEDACRHLVEHYEWLLEQGVAPEQARMILPQNMMTEWIWTGSLVAFARVCKLRLDPHAQAETSEVARGIADAIAPLFPVAWKELMNANH